MLATCQRILEYLEDMGYSPETLKDATEPTWREAVQESCEERSNETVENVVKIYSNVFQGIDRLLEIFEGRPNIWTRNALVGFLGDTGRGILTDKQSGTPLSPDDTVNLLYTMGMMGLGFRSQFEPTGSRVYEMVFSYIRWTRRRGWELGIISPVFYDSLRINVLAKIVVRPHDRLRMRLADYDRVSSYDYRINAFSTYG